MFVPKLHGVFLRKIDFFDMSDNRHSGGGYSIQAVQIEPKENEDKNDDDEHEHRLCLLKDMVDSDIFSLQVVSLAKRLQGLS